MSCKSSACVALVFAVLFFSGCTQTAANDAAKMYGAMLEAQPNITTMQANFEAQLDTVTMTGTLYVKQNKMREDMELQVPGANGSIARISARAYVLDSGVYSCTNVDGAWHCSEVHPITKIDRYTSNKILTDLFNKNALVFDAAVVQKTVSGFACAEVKTSVNLAALTKEEKYFLLAVGGLSTTPNPDDYAQRIQSFEMTACITADKVSVYDETTLTLSGASRPVKITKTLKNYTINQQIQDEVFVVP